MHTRPAAWLIAPVIALFAMGAGVSARASVHRARTTPIRHVIEIMLENHTYDSLFASFPGARGVAAGTTLPAPQPDGTPVAPVVAGPNEGEVQGGLNNSRSAELTMMDRRGARYLMNGYTRFPGEGLSAITEFPPSMDPNLQYAARHYELLDANFQPVIGPTLPNVLAALAGTNGGWTTNAQPPPSRTWTTIFDQLAAHGESSGFYTGVPPADLAGSLWPRLLPSGEQLQPVSAFLRALRLGHLRAFSFVRPGVGYSEEAPEDVGEGDAWLGQLLAAIGRSGQWSSTAVFITYDEGGGFWDGVSPPVRTGEGTRTPTVIVSPDARRGVLSAPTTNLSVLAFVEHLFGLPPLTPAVGRANDLAAAFDGARHPLPPPEPPVAPVATVGFTGSSPLSDPPATTPGAVLPVTFTARNAALSPIHSAAILHVQLVPPPGVAVPPGFPRRVRLQGGTATVALRFGTRGYYRLRVDGPGGMLGDLTVQVGVSANTP